VPVELLPQKRLALDEFYVQTLIRDGLHHVQKFSYMVQTLILLQSCVRKYPRHSFVEIRDRHAGLHV
jgi:hypothetical protein